MQDDLLEANLLSYVVKSFIKCFYVEYKAKLVGGAEEPFYRAPRENEEGIVFFRSNFLRSALHESAHWCLAGEERLKLDDWGYWYEPDGRDDSQQEQFFKVEVKPQSIERGLCEALGVPFEVSVDNIEGPEGPVEQFKLDVEEQYLNYTKNGFPVRAQKLITELKSNLSSVII